ncbi:unnamed protein product, partial [Oppiella nova]
MSVASLLIPYSQSLPHIYACGLAVGLGSGCWNSIANVWLIEIWQNRSAPFLQLIQFMYGIGTILSPLVNQLFLNDDDITANTLSHTFVNKSAQTVDLVEMRRESLKTPFLINGLIQFTFPTLLVLMYVIRRYEVPEQILPDTIDYKNKKSEQKKNLFKTSDESPRKTLILMFAILLMFYNACEGLHFQFGPSYYQNMELRLTANRAAGIISVLAIAYTIGRGVNVFVAIKIRAKAMIEYHFLIVIIGFILLFFSQNSLVVLRIANLVLGFGFSALFPAMFAFIKQYIDITNQIGT